MFSTLQLTQTVALSIAVVKGSNLAQCHSHSQFNITTVCCHHSDMKPDTEQASRSNRHPDPNRHPDSRNWSEWIWIPLAGPWFWGRPAWIISPKASSEKGWCGSNSKSAFSRFTFFFLFFFKIGKTQTKVEWKQKQQLGTCSPRSLHFQTEGWLFFKLFFFFFFNPRAPRSFCISAEMLWISRKCLFTLLWGLAKGLFPPLSAPLLHPLRLQHPSFFHLPLPKGQGLVLLLCWSQESIISPSSRENFLIRGVKSKQGNLPFLFAASPPFSTAK